MLKKQHGITLIALVITIVVSLILVGIALNLTVGDNGVLTKAKESKFKADMSGYNDNVKMYTSGEEIKQVNKNTINAGLEQSTLQLKDIIPNFDENSYGEKVVVVKGTMYYFAPEPKERSRQIKREVKWCEEIGIGVYTGKVDLYESYDDIEPPGSQWVTVNGVSYYSPDVKKFSKENTYYVDSTGEIVGRTNRIEPPTNWYDYKEKQWANIVTVNGTASAFWVWIPRYEYKKVLDETGKETQKMDVKFITTERTNNGTTAETMPDEGYEIPESFTFAGQELTGYWISKYELSNTNNGGFNVDITGADAVIEALPTAGNYKIFVDGLYKATSELPYTIPGLRKDIMYNIMIVGPDGNPVGEQDVCVEGEEIEPPDLSKFNKAATYYVDSTGKVTGRVDKTEEPSNWYSYKNKEWANIVTVTDNNVAYWVWIPRYEYKLSVNDQKSDVKFIPKTQTQPNSGYEIPESFEFGGEQLSGYWISKYELSTSTTEVLSCDIETNAINVKPFKADDTKKYSFFIDGKEYNNGQSYTLPYKIEGLNSGQSYNIMVMDDELKQPVLERDIVTNSNKFEAPDLSGFKSNCTYYVTWDAEGNETRTPITGAPPTNWYNYENREWANIVTTGATGDVEAYWVWIPRYEYKLYSQTQKVTVKYIDKNTTKPDAGYEIPESFTFGGQQLSGYWISKYELSSK